MKTWGDNFRNNSLWVKASGKKAQEGHDRCPKCMIRFAIFAARRNGHEGFCSKACSQGKERKLKKRLRKGIRFEELALSPSERKKARQLRRSAKIKKDRIDFYKSEEWQKLRYKILRKYKYQCMACGRKPPNVIIHVDHIKPRSKYPELELEPDNLQLLCEDCNLGKSNLSEDDLRHTDFLTDAARVGFD